jgi:hypothetical protein
VVALHGEVQALVEERVLVAVLLLVEAHLLAVVALVNLTARSLLSVPHSVRLQLRLYLQ